MSNPNMKMVEEKQVVGRVIIAGSRHINSYDEVYKALAENNIKPTVILSGGAKGVDTIGENYATNNGIDIEKYPADWGKHGRSAGPIRNAQMVANADIAVFVWDGKSRGTKDCISKARMAGLKVFVRVVGEETINPTPLAYVEDEKSLARLNLWIEALESGQYIQGTGTMREGERYCCLGVLCDVSGLGKWINDEYVLADDHDGGSFDTPPQRVDDWLGVFREPSTRATRADSNIYVETREGRHPLSELNDSGNYSFSEIASILKGIRNALL